MYAHPNACICKHKTDLERLSIFKDIIIMLGFRMLWVGNSGSGTRRMMRICDLNPQGCFCDLAEDLCKQIHQLGVNFFLR